MNMFPSLLNSIPKNRSDFVDDLAIPDITLTPYVCPDPYYDTLSSRSDSILADSMRAYDRGSLSTASSIALSRALTDSDIDYGFYKRYRDYHYADTWEHLRRAVDAFPPYYLSSLNSYISVDTDDELLLNKELAYAADLAESRRLYNEAWRRRMRRRFDDIYAYTPDDPGLYELQEAVRQLDMKALEADLARIRRRP